MKKIVKWILPLVLIAALIGSAIWYMFVYDRNTVQDFLVSMARRCTEDGNFKGATWFYDLSYQLSDEDQDVAIELADIYASAGNYTKAEYTLANAIADGGSAELYTALCRTYVAQDKLLDAVNMLDNITDPTLKAELDALRPAIPTTDAAPGFYNQYITLNFQHGGSTLYVTTNGDYPTTEIAPYADPITLEQGETKIYAISVGENGLVSPLAIFNYTVGGVIEPVTLTDPAMEALVREKLMFGTDTVIYTSDLWTIEEMTVPAEVQDLSDLALMTHLKKLTLAERQIPSLSFLSGMTALEGEIIKIDTPWSPDYKNITVTIVCDGKTEQPIMCYRLSGEGAETLAVGDKIAVYGSIKNYKGTIEFDKGCKVLPYGSAKDVRTLLSAYTLEEGLAMDKAVTLTGVIHKIPTPYSDQYKNITVDMTVAGLVDLPIECYRLSGEGAEGLAIGDTITVTGIIKNYKGLIEFDKGCTLDVVVKAE